MNTEEVRKKTAKLAFSCLPLLYVRHTAPTETEERDIKTVTARRRMGSNNGRREEK